MELCTESAITTQMSRLAIEGGSRLGGVGQGLGQLLANPKLQVHILPTILMADECNCLCSCCPYGPVILEGALPYALGDHARHEWGDQLVQIQLQVDVRTEQHALCNLHTGVRLSG